MENQDCIFCKICAGEIPAKKVHEDTSHIAFLDIRPASKGHTLVIPKKHYANFLEMPEQELKDMFGLVQNLGNKLKANLNAQLVFLLVMGEEVPHAHVHLIPYYGAMPVGLTGSDSTDLDQVLEEINKPKQI